MTTLLQNLVEMSQSLGEPALDYVIVCEGNSSALEDDQTFWEKASGSSLRNITEASNGHPPGNPSL